MSVFLRTPYNYDMNAASDESALHCTDESLTIQSAADDADINTIVRRFGLTGELPGDLKMPQSGDFTGVGDFHSAMNLVREAHEEFLRVPAEVRAKFHNDPQEFMDFLGDPDNRAAADKMGLLAAMPKPPEPLSVRVIPDDPVK